MARLGVEVRTGCTVNTLSQNRNGYAVLFDSAERSNETLHADAVICAMGGNAGPQFGTDGFGTRFAAQCGGKLEPLYPCLTALQTARPNKALAGIRVKARAALLDLDRHTLLAEEAGEVQFTDYGLSGICIMQLSGLLAPRRGPKRPAVELDLFPALDEAALTALFAARVPLLPGRTPASSSGAVRGCTSWAKRWTAPGCAAASTCTGPSAAASPPGGTPCAPCAARTKRDDKTRPSPAHLPERAGSFCVLYSFAALSSGASSASSSFWYAAKADHMGSTRLPWNLRST